MIERILNPRTQEARALFLCLLLAGSTAVEKKRPPVMDVLSNLPIVTLVRRARRGRRQLAACPSIHPSADVAAR